MWPVRLDRPLSAVHSSNLLMCSSAIFKKLISILFGIYAWEIVNTMHVEKALLLRIRQFQWPHSTLNSCPFFLLSLGSHSPLLPLPIHPLSRTPWPVSPELVFRAPKRINIPYLIGSFPSRWILRSTVRPSFPLSSGRGILPSARPPRSCSSGPSPCGTVHLMSPPQCSSSQPDSGVFSITVS